MKNEKHISTIAILMVTKLATVVTYCRELPLINLSGPLNEVNL